MQRFLSALLFLLPFFAAGQSDSIALDSNFRVEFVAYWATGDQYRYEVEKHDIRYQDEETTKNDTTRYTALLTVLDSTATSYRLSWKFEKVEKTTAEGEALTAQVIEKASEDLTSVFKFDEVVFTTDEFGAFQRIENTDEIIQTLDVFIEQIMANTEEEYAGQPENLEKIKKALNVTSASMRTPAYVENTMFAEIIHLLHPLGAAFSPTDTLFYDDVFPNNFGGPDIKASGRYHFDTLDVQNDYCHLKQYIDLDPDDTVEMLKDYFVRIGLDSDEIIHALEESSYDMWENNDYYYYYYPGIPVSIDQMRVLDFTFKGETYKSVKRTIIDWVD